jgi:hypothetical protein
MRLEFGARAALARLFGVAALLAAGLYPAHAQPAPPTPEQQKAVEQLCLAKARTEMLGRIAALPISEGVTVRDWLMRDADLDRTVRLWTRARPAQGHARLYADAVCEVDLRIAPGESLTELLSLVEAFPAAATATRVDADKLKSAAARWPILWTTGRAAVSKGARSGQPIGWEDVAPEGTELARAAATADAYNALMVAAGRLKVTSARRLREFLDSSDEVRQAVQGELQRAARPKVDFAPDQVVVVEVRVSLRDLLRILTRVHQEHYHGEDFEAADFREMALLAGQDELTATGLATPPSESAVRSRYEPIEFDVPEWAATTLAATGRYTAAAGETVDPDAAGEAARLDGSARLYQQTEKLVIQKNVAIGEFLGYHQELKDDVALFLSGTRVVAAPTALPAGGVEVKVELPLRRLWEIVRRGMKLEEVEPPTTAPSSPAEKETP